MYLLKDLRLMQFSEKWVRDTMMRDNSQKQTRSLANFHKRSSFWVTGVKNMPISGNPDSGLNKYCNFSVDFFSKITMESV